MKIKSVKELKNKLYKRTLLDEIKYYGFYIWYNKIEMLPLYIKSFFQRGFRGWADADTWDFDLYLANVITQGLKHLKEHNHGCPSDIYEKYRNRKDLTQHQKDKLAVAEWKNIMQQIIEGFENVPYLFDTIVLKNKPKRDKYFNSFDKALILFKKYYFNLWD